MEIIVGIVSLVLIPFLGLLSSASRPLFQILAIVCAIWLLLGLFTLWGAPDTELLKSGLRFVPREPMTPPPAIQFARNLWLVGLAIGTPLLAIAWLHEQESAMSTVLKIIILIIKVTAFVGGLLAFIDLFVVPRFFS